MDYIVVKENVQEAVAEACRQDIRTVVIPAGVWQLEKPVLLPDGVTVILQDAQLRAKGCAFVNEKAALPFALATEQKNIHILGVGNATVTSQGEEPLIRFQNLRQFSVSGVTFFGGDGVELLHAREGSLEKLTFSGCERGLTVKEGCRELLVTDILANTREEAIALIGGTTAVWGRSNVLTQCMFNRIQCRTAGAPAISVRQGQVETDNLIFRDITDITEGDGVSVLLGDGEAALWDVTVRSLCAGQRTAEVLGACDGIFLQGGVPVIREGAARVLTAPAAKPARFPQMQSLQRTEYISANEPAFRGETDADTLQNAIEAACRRKISLVIPRYNARTGKCFWEVGKTVKIPSGTTVVLLDAHLRMADYTYCNMFAAEAAENIRMIGIGSATLDSGIPNGLKLKNAGKLGFGPITDNALVQLCNTRNAEITGVRLCQSRWYGIYCMGCTNVNIGNIHFFAPPVFPDLGGIYIAGGCRDIVIESITGETGADTVLVEATKQMGAGDINNVSIEGLLVNANRCCAVRVFCHDGFKINNIKAESIIDSSVPEQKKLPRAMVCIGQYEGWMEKPVESGDLTDVLVRDICGRSSATVELGGKSENVVVENIHSIGSTAWGLLSSPDPEVTDFIVRDTQEKLCGNHRKALTQLENCRVDGLFFRCHQGSAYMRGTATSIITDKKKFVGTVMDLRGLQTQKLTVKNVLAEKVGAGIIVTGKANVLVEKLSIALCGREETRCGANCTLFVDGKECEITKTVEL